MKSAKKRLGLALLVLGAFSAVSVEAGLRYKAKVLFRKITKSQLFKDVTKQSAEAIKGAATEVLVEAAVAQATGMPYDPVAQMQQKTQGQFTKIVHNVEDQLAQDIQSKTGLPTYDIKNKIDAELAKSRAGY